MSLPEPPVAALRWRGTAPDGCLEILDQTRLPVEEVWNARTTVEAVEEDIRRLAVRGAPAIGVAAAFGLVLAARALAAAHDDRAAFDVALRGAAERLAGTRPTAVNLRAAVTRSVALWQEAAPVPAGSAEVLLTAALALEAYERAATEAIAEAGARRLAGCEWILTHCNAGALVTPGLGTALAPLYLMHARGLRLHVWVDETRPLLQGLRLTAFELGRAGIPHAVVTEGAAASLFRDGRVDAVITGADRVCANGDVVNKVGTYGVAALARMHEVPFLVAAPLTTLDPGTARGDDVDIEQRRGDGRRYLREGTMDPACPTWEPAFDVTPAALVTALVTERGVLDRPTEEGLAAWMAAAGVLQRGGDPGR